MFDHTKFTTVEEAVEAAGVIELPGEYIARETGPDPQPPQEWHSRMGKYLTGRWEDSNPPGTPA